MDGKYISCTWIQYTHWACTYSTNLLRYKCQAHHIARTERNSNAMPNSPVRPLNQWYRGICNWVLYFFCFIWPNNSQIPSIFRACWEFIWSKIGSMLWENNSPQIHQTGNFQHTFWVFALNCQRQNTFTLVYMKSTNLCWNIVTSIESGRNEWSNVYVMLWLHILTRHQNNSNNWLKKKFSTKNKTNEAANFRIALEIRGFYT